MSIYANKRQRLFFILQVISLCVIGFFMFGCSTLDFLLPSSPESQVEKAVDPAKNSNSVARDDTYAIEFANVLQETLENDSVEKALELFDEVPPEYSSDEKINYLHASLLISSGQLDKASDIVTSLQVEDPDNTDLQLLNALILKESGDKRGSKALIEDILEKEPNNVAANVEMANTFLIAKNFRSANKYFAYGLRGNPEDPAALFGYSMTSWYLENDDIALESLSKLVELEPENSTAWAYLAKFSADKGKFEDAVSNIQKAIEFDSEYYYHWLDLGSYYRNLNKQEEAEAAWSKAIEIDPEYFLGYAYRGGIRDEMKKYDEALSDYQSVIKYNPDYYFAYETSALLYWRNEQWVDARNAFLMALDANKDSVSYALMVSATYLKEGRVAENKEFLSQVMKTMDRSSLDYLVVRLYYDGLGDNAVLNKVVNTESITERGRMLFYMALFYELHGHTTLANKYYLEITGIQAPMFFEYRMSEWAVERMRENNEL